MRGYQAWRERGLPVEHNHRGLFFNTTTSNILAVHYNPPGCLIVLEPQDEVLPDLPDRLKLVLPLSQLDQIDTQGNQAYPPPQLGREPAHDWCFYFQKAELARQQKNWESVASFGDQAINAGFHWQSSSELLPFIEGYAHTGNLEKARQFTQEASQAPGMQPALCLLWERIGQLQDAKLIELATSVRKEIGCSP